MDFERAFAQWASRLELPAHEAFFGFSYSSLEMIEQEKRRGKFIVLGQIDTGALHQRIIKEEQARWPAYAEPELEFPDEYFARARREWALADLLVVNSEWTRAMLLAEGVPASKVALLPLAFPQKSERRVQSPIHSEELSVLWLGNVSLGKGIQYLFEAAKLLSRESIRFAVAGHICISNNGVQQAPANVRLIGPIAYAQVSDFLSQGHVFVFPTLSDGFGMTQVEALSHGLPVIATPNCGAVVEHGVTGFIVPPRSPGELAAAIKRLHADRNLLESMRARCLERAGEWSFERFKGNLESLVAERGICHHQDGAKAPRDVRAT